MPSVVIHMTNEDPVFGEIDEYPSAADTILTLKNPRRRDGKDLPYLEPNVSIVLFPLTRVSFIEILSGGEDEEIITFVRE